MAAPKKVDYDKIEPGWRAGLLSPRALAAAYAAETGESVSHAAIIKHFEKAGIPRDLSERIRQAAQEKLARATVNDAPVAKATEDEIIDAGSNIVANLQIGWRKDIARAMDLARTLLAELEIQTGSPEALESLLGSLLSGDDSRAAEAFKRLTSLPSRMDSMKKAADTLKTLIGLQREAYNIDGKRTPGQTLDEFLDHLAANEG